MLNSERSKRRVREETKMNRYDMLQRALRDIQEITIQAELCPTTSQLMFELPYVIDEEEYENLKGTVSGTDWKLKATVLFKTKTMHGRTKIRVSRKVQRKNKKI